MDTVQNYENLKDTLAQASNDRGEPHWFTARRLAAVDQMVDLPLPEVQRFDYHRWPVTPTEQGLKHVRSNKKLAANVDIREDSVQITQVGQTTISTNLPDDLFDQGVILTDIFTAFREHPRLTQKYFMDKVINTGEDRLTSYHTAFLNAGIFLFVPKGVTIKQPIEAHIIQDSTQRAPLVSHVLIIAEEDSHFSFIQHLTTQGDQKNLASCVVEILARANSHVGFSSLDEFGHNTTTYLNRRAYLSRDANVDWAIAMMNDGNTIADFDSELVGSGSKADSKVVAITAGDQHNGINTRVTNRGKHTTGNILQRGVIEEKSMLIFNGIGSIIHGAHGANAEQENRVLMMSDQARGDANPILLIDEDDVIAGHAASVGQVDAEQLYYLMSRGIDKKTAQRLVIRGFLGAVLIAVPSKAVRQRMIQTIERKLEHGQNTQTDQR
ncbi:FeS assembly protein SufD [Lentilactobacillus parafarraginis F0439]|uniref:FeS assembly protein SufD n=1 Tax=Lentilactobacillus parafarraginis F0439 TaxID=797515 RepID=G9ZTL1_9LACO|nr:Fe-S cluster assembly protein SufD [Lentilactobacillus parafarraginis]EHL95124.1 FeS assembly protein SufD [Lentilactobacillus parafarraginis F0439]